MSSRHAATARTTGDTQDSHTSARGDRARRRTRPDCRLRTSNRRRVRLPPLSVVPANAATAPVVQPGRHLGAHLRASAQRVPRACGGRACLGRSGDQHHGDRPLWARFRRAADRIRGVACDGSVRPWSAVVGGRTHASSGDRRQRSAVVRVVRNAPCVEFYAGHIEGSRIVHLTARSFLVEALCGEAACLDGEPDIAVICEECDKLGREAGGDPGTWVAEATVRVELRVAA